ncbi:hypothetical protein AOR13_619 [Alteromonas stellipolaris LMG 21856]|nr:hypothetical protein AOR13_619 [Alteromonas stellipolaris LMG 21856]
MEIYLRNLRKINALLRLKILSSACAEIPELSLTALIKKRRSE